MNWHHFKNHYLEIEHLEFALDYSRIKFDVSFFENLEPKMQAAFKGMKALESGYISNPDENRRVGHYWLRDPKNSPEENIKTSIEDCINKIEEIKEAILQGNCSGASGSFQYLLIIGIGGSALGPQFVENALADPSKSKIKTFYFDNTDPDGIERILQFLEGSLGRTLSIVISKSGGTAETRNGMVEAKHAYEKAGLDFSKHAIAITGENSNLDQIAKNESWLYRLPMWDWVGGRTSVLSAVGLLPAALQGIEIVDLLTGAKDMDEVTRSNDTENNPSALLAATWFHCTKGKGAKDMVILPYKDRLMLFSKYLQQLIMESLGKEIDLDNNIVNQGIAVYGNKGSTDQHAYVQQLREGVNNFFVTFIEVLKDRKGIAINVDSDKNNTGDYLHGFYLGTREALTEKNRESITITIKEVTPKSIGQLIALFERAVGYYAHLININAYHQPGVEAGKKAASTILKIKKEIYEILRSESPNQLTIEEISRRSSFHKKEEIIFKLLNRLSNNESTQLHASDETPNVKSKFFYKE